MQSFSQQMTGLAPWRRTATVVLMVLAVALFVLVVAGVLQTAGAIGGLVIVVASYLVGPRSPLFHADPA